MPHKSEVLKAVTPLLTPTEQVSSDDFFNARELVRGWLGKAGRTYREQRFNQTLRDAWNAIENGEKHRFDELLTKLNKNK